jgi:hypothetical protein
MERQFDERSELRDRVKHNADLYRRDVQFGIDLLEDTLAGRITLSRARADLRDAYERGREELKDTDF